MHPEWTLVLGLGRKAAAKDLGTVPENVFLLDWAPQIEILQQADAAITHGGSSTINECVRFAVPMVVYSTGHVDQPGNTARVAYHGLGLAADRRRDGPGAIARNVERVLHDEAMRGKLCAMQRALLAYEESEAAVRCVESFLEPPRRGAPGGSRFGADL
jgi:UDP:flavonoid glycosyltransferase YjiC (YdhE family)